jgi:hypothetical protein
MIQPRFAGTTGSQKHHAAAKIAPMPYFAILTIACIGGIDFQLAKAWKKANLWIIVLARSVLRPFVVGSALPYDRYL